MRMIVCTLTWVKLIDKKKGEHLPQSMSLCPEVPEAFKLHHHQELNMEYFIYKNLDNYDYRANLLDHHQALNSQ